jgi:salicylate hydroxylase
MLIFLGADGIKSLVRVKVVGDEAFRTARPSGSSAFRFTLPREVVENIDPDFRAIDRSKPASLQIYEGVGRQAIVYPCRNFDLVNVGCIASDELIGQETTESWFARGTREDLLKTYDGFDPKLLSIFRYVCHGSDDPEIDADILPSKRQAKDIRLWQLRDQDPLPTYVKGRTVIIGDAAHSMTPHQGQGGNQAIEDAEGFFLFKGHHIDRASVKSILRDFDRVRRERASTIQMHTRDQHGRKDPSKMWKYTQYNFTYPGVRECLERLNAGAEMIAL